MLVALERTNHYIPDVKLKARPTSMLANIWFLPGVTFELMNFAHPDVALVSRGTRCASTRPLRMSLSKLVLYTNVLLKL